MVKLYLACVAFLSVSNDFRFLKFCQVLDCCKELKQDGLSAFKNIYIFFKLHRWFLPAAG